MSWNRRQFLTTAAATVFVMHDAHARDEPDSRRPAGPAGDEPRILALRLACAAPLAEMRAFYRDRLGLPVLGEDAKSLTVAGGRSRLTFVAAEPAGDGSNAGEPFYHFAFNIPENKILAAREWQLERSPLIAASANVRDPKLPADVIDYRHWNAHSVFFWDPGGNLVEYIARHDLQNAAPGPFGPDDLLYASEIGLIVDDVDATAAGLRSTFALEQYRGGSELFRAIGDERGLLLAMKRGRMLGFGEARPAGIYPTEARIRAATPASFRHRAFPYEIVTG